METKFTPEEIRRIRDIKNSDEFVELSRELEKNNYSPYLTTVTGASTQLSMLNCLTQRQYLKFSSEFFLNSIKREKGLVRKLKGAISGGAGVVFFYLISLPALKIASYTDRE